MSRLEWDKTGERLYEAGVEKAVLYVQVGDGTYPKGVAWNGLTGVDESPSGAEATPLYANDSKYLNLYSAEEFAATVKAYTYPKEFEECDGSAELETGIYIGQQERKAFGLSYRTILGNDVEGGDHGYKIHLVYGGKASPSEKSYSTISDNPDAIEFSWEVETTPVNVPGFKPTSVLTIDSTKVDEKTLKAIEDALYGTEDEEAYLPLPNEIAEMAKGSEGLSLSDSYM